MSDDFIFVTGAGGAIGRIVARWQSGPPTLAALGPVKKFEDFARLEARLNG